MQTTLEGLDRQQILRDTSIDGRGLPEIEARHRSQPSRKQDKHPAATHPVVIHPIVIHTVTTQLIATHGHFT